MTSTRDWMRRVEDPLRPLRAGPPLGGVVVWVFGLVIVTLAALTLLQPFA